jgi:endonuclease/exonuclease/phosphatase family metal-dependent hydrolase
VPRHHRRHKVLFTNLGYARGIGGSLREHARYAYRYIWCPRGTQRDAIAGLKRLIRREDPEVCCLVEIDRGSVNSAFFNQMDHLVDGTWRYHDIENKYGETSPLRHLPVTSGKCNGFVAKRSLPFRKIYFTGGTKRLVYKIDLDEGLTLFFAHFSLRREVREGQFRELRELFERTAGEVAIMGDFNIFRGRGELAPLLDGGGLEVVSGLDDDTFRIDGRRFAVDLCVCSTELARRAEVRVLEQSYSDHAAIVLEVGG